jgi:hypothetical protein
MHESFVTRNASENVGGWEHAQTGVYARAAVVFVPEIKNRDTKFYF